MCLLGTYRGLAVNKLEETPQPNAAISQQLQKPMIISKLHKGDDNFTSP
jgi:hypothetical protein